MYILFAGMVYEERGGAHDIYFVGTTIKDCRKEFRDAAHVFGKHGDQVWYHIYDVIENKIIEKGTL